jgi:hypothetical protein
MHSPPTSPPKYGASCTTGGLFRGHAIGNALNATNYSNSNNQDYVGPVPGQIFLYVSQDDPAHLVPESLTAYASLSYDYSPKTPITLVLEKIARKYSPVCSMQLTYFIFELIV